MTVASITIRSNPLQGTPVEINDLGAIIIGASGASETFTTEEQVQEIRESEDLRSYLLDEVHGTGSSTLQLMDGATPVNIADIEAFLDAAIFPNTGPYSFMVRDATGVAPAGEDDYSIYTRVDGTRPFSAPVAGVDPTLPAHLATKDYVDSAGSGISETQHEVLDTLAHSLVEDFFEEFTYDSQGRPTHSTVYTDGTKTTKIRECIFTYDPQARVSQLDEIQYDGTGTEDYRLTHTPAYDGGTSRILTVTTTRTP